MSAMGGRNSLCKISGRNERWIDGSIMECVTSVVPLILILGSKGINVIIVGMKVRTIRFRGTPLSEPHV